MKKGIQTLQDLFFILSYLSLNLYKVLIFVMMFFQYKIVRKLLKWGFLKSNQPNLEIKNLKKKQSQTAKIIISSSSSNYPIRQTKRNHIVYYIYLFIFIIFKLCLFLSNTSRFYLLQLNY